MKKLVIVESPSKAKKIQKYLGKGWHVLASMGHVRDLPPKALGVDVKAGFAPTYEVSKGKGKVVQRIRSAAKGASAIYLATDPDREGEAIAWHVLSAMGSAVKGKPIYRVTFNSITKKAIQSAFNKPRQLDMALVNSQQARRVLDRLVGWKVSPVLRRIFGTSLSAGRVQSVAVRLVVERELEIESFKKEQFWTLDARFARQTKEQEEFNARLAALLDPLDKELDPKKLPTERVHAIAEELSTPQTTWRVVDIEGKERTRRAPPPFITSTLQQKASSVLKMKPKRAMQVAQKLYEKGLITYMRTDSPFVAPPAQYAARDVISSIFGPNALPKKPPYYRAKGNAQEAHECVRPTDPKLLPKNTKLSGEEAALYRLIWMRFIASQMKPARYDVTIVTIEPSHWGTALPYHFAAKGSILREQGWLALYNIGRTASNDPDEQKKGDNNNEASQVLPPLQPNEQVDLRQLGGQEHWTKPPSRYSEPSLIQALEKAGVGRPSTYASIMDTIQKRGYVEVKKKVLVPTKSGRAVTKFLVEQFPNLLNIGFTKQMEDDLDRVAEGKVAWDALMGQFYGPLAKRVAIAKQASPEESLAPIKPCPKCGDTMETRYSSYGKYEQCTFCGHKPNAAQETGQACPECARPLMKRKGRYGFFVGCSGYPECKYIDKTQKKGKGKGRRKGKGQSKAKGASSNSSDPEILSMLEQPCPQCGQQLAHRKGRYGPFIGCTGYPQCNYMFSFSNSKPKSKAKSPKNQAQAAPDPNLPGAGQPCPQCGKQMVVKKGRYGPFVACPGYPACKYIHKSGT
ncbi:MAG: type I DNA topoisomerase [Ardenticatenaceae bacterium]